MRDTLIVLMVLGVLGIACGGYWSWEHQGNLGLGVLMIAPVLGVLLGMLTGYGIALCPRRRTLVQKWRDAAPSISSTKDVLR